MVDTKNIKYHTITKHWGNPSFCQEFSVKLEKWLLQLNELEKPLMLNLLKHFYYYTEERLNSKAIKLYQKYKEEYSTDCDFSVYTKIEKETGVGFSSFIFETFWVKNGLKDSASDKFMNEVQTWDTLPEVLAIIDDYSGTGATFINYINKLLKIKPELKSIKFYFLVIHVSKDALLNISAFAEQQGLYIHCIYLDESDRAFKEGYIYEAIESEIQKNKYRKLCEEHNICTEYSFGYKQIAALVSFEYNTPNDTLGAFWYELDGFMSLFHRHKSKRTPLQQLRQKAHQNQNFRGRKIVIQNIEETKLNMFMVYCVTWGKNFSVARACYDFGLTLKQFNDVITELIEEKYLEYDDGKLVASDKMKKYVFSSRMSDFKQIFYDLTQKNVLPLDMEQTDTYIPKNFGKRR